MSSREYFLGKRIAVIGIGARGEMLADIRFMVKANALVSVYDLRSESRLLPHQTALRSMGLANLVCGAVPSEDLLDMDLIVLSHEYPRGSSFLSEAKKAGIQIEYPETLFLKLAPPITVIGVMGAAGKATLVSMLAPMIEAKCAQEGSQSSIVIDPESGDGVIRHLRSAKNGDIVVMRIEQRMMPEISALKWSPHIAVFASAPHVTGGAGSPYEILAHQTYNNYVIGTDATIDAVRGSGHHSKAKLLRTKASMVPPEWLPNSKNIHDREDASLALEAARLFKVSDETAQAVLMDWKPLKGRTEHIKKVKGVEFWNDTASTAPAATVAGLAAVSSDRNVVLIMGGADHGADGKELYVALPQYAHTAILVPGSGTLAYRKALAAVEGVSIISAPSLEEAVRLALEHAKKGDRVLFSPGFEAYGTDSSRVERGDRFIRAVRSL